MYKKVVSTYTSKLSHYFANEKSFLIWSFFLKKVETKQKGFFNAMKKYKNKIITISDKKIHLKNSDIILRFFLLDSEKKV